MTLPRPSLRALRRALRRAPPAARAPALVALVALALTAGAARSQGQGQVVLLRGKGAQLDEAVASLKAEVGAVGAELVVDEATSAAAVRTRTANAGVVVAVGERAARLALQQDRAPVVHCMVLQDAAAFDGPKSAGVPLGASARARLEAMKRLAPSARRVGVLYDPRVNTRAVTELEAAARASGHAIVKGSVSSSTAAPAALDALLPRIDALIVVPDATVVTKQLVTFLVGRAFEHRLPVLAFSEALVRVGVLAALAPAYADNGRLCGRLARRVLAGEAPAVLHGAVEMPATLVVNRASARRIGLALSADVLRPPTRVVGE